MHAMGNASFFLFFLFIYMVCIRNNSQTGIYFSEAGTDNPRTV